MLKRLLLAAGAVFLIALAFAGLAISGLDLNPKFIGSQLL